VLSTPFGALLADNPKDIGGEASQFWRGMLVSLSKQPVSPGYFNGSAGPYPGSQGMPIELVEPFAVYGELLNLMLYFLMLRHKRGNL
jgi:hypothetical protein